MRQFFFYEKSSPKKYAVKADGGNLFPEVEFDTEAAGDAEYLEEERGAVRISSESLGAVLYPVPKDSFFMELTLMSMDAGEVGIALHTDTGMENGYFLRISPSKGTAAWDMWPR